jgi:Leucine rich repeat
MNISVVIFVFSFSAYVSSIKLECTFQINADKLYTCINTNLEIDENNEIVDEVQGNHLLEKEDSDVQAVYLLSSAMYRLPNVFLAFPHLYRYVVHGLDVKGKYLDSKALVQGDFNEGRHLNSFIVTGVYIKQIRHRVFKGAENLKFLSIETCRVQHIEFEAFAGLKKLQSLSLSYNLIKSLDAEMFKDLENLEMLMFAGNLIKEISENLFVYLINIREISFINNKLEVVDKDSIEPLNNLEKFYLEHNICPNLSFGTMKTSLSSFETAAEDCTEENTHEHQIRHLRHEIIMLREKLHGGHSSLPEFFAEEDDFDDDFDYELKQWEFMRDEDDEENSEETEATGFDKLEKIVKTMKHNQETKQTDNTRIGK